MTPDLQMPDDRAYYAQRAAEEGELALAAKDSESAAAHRKMQIAYLEKASVGGRAGEVREEIG